MNENTGHGHVFPRPDGVRARCGGPGICDECSRDLARKLANPPSDTINVLNYEEARELAEIKKEESNLARCFLDLQRRLKEANEVLVEFQLSMGGSVDKEDAERYRRVRLEPWIVAKNFSFAPACFKQGVELDVAVDVRRKGLV